MENEAGKEKQQTAQKCPEDSLLLQVRDLSLWIRKDREEIRILDRLNFQVRRGERLGIAGESGAGKSMTIHALTGLLPQGNVRMEGEIIYYGQNGAQTDVLRLPYEERQRFCAGQTSLILQDSMNALNPYETVEKQWGRVILLHQENAARKDPRQRSGHGGRKRDGRQRSEALREHMLRLLPVYGLADEEESLQEAARILKKYPHQISGGMKQRIAIAMALESPAELLIADEPTTALDALNQRRMVDFIRGLCEENGLTLLYISHNLGILNELCTHVMVMKDGRIAEQGRTADVFGSPAHPYTAQLIRRTAELWAVDAGGANVPDGSRAGELWQKNAGDAAIPGSSGEIGGQDEE